MHEDFSRKEEIEGSSDQSFGLVSFLFVQYLPPILLVQQFCKPILDAVGKSKSRQIVRDLDFYLDTLRHFNAPP